MKIRQVRESLLQFVSEENIDELKKAKEDLDLALEYFAADKLGKDFSEKYKNAMKKLAEN